MQFGFNHPFKEQLEFFEQKLNLPSDRWDDITKSAHDKAFIVAGAADADLLQDLNDAIKKAIREGKGIEEFRRDFKQIVKNRGWTGWTGQGTKGGEAWRTRIIYQTNMATSYSAGRYKQLTDPEYLKIRPLWTYHHLDGVEHPRIVHVSWNGVTLPHDHIFWKTHFPINAFGCHCWVTAARPGAKIVEPPPGWQTIDAKTGTYVGIGKGFDYAPGASVTKPMQSFIDDKLIKLDAAIGAAMWQKLSPVIAKDRELMWWDKLDALTAAKRPDGGYTVLSAMPVDVVDWLAVNNKPLPMSAEIAVPNYLPFGSKQARHQAAANALSIEEWRSLPSTLNAPGAIYFDTRNNTLIFVAEEIGPTKMAIEFDPIKSERAGANMILTTFRVDDVSIAAEVKGGQWEIVKVSGRR